MSKNPIIVKGAKVNNLKNIDVKIPANQLVVITGLSGSGKSSLAFDTLYAEGQRRYVESLSSYARQFMGKLTKPNVKAILNIPPAIAIEQRIISRNPRSTVGTITEIYEYLKLLYARIGKTFSPISGQEVTKDDVQDVIRYCQQLPPDAKVYICSPIVTVSERTLYEQLEILKKQGFSRLICDKIPMEIDDLLDQKKISKNASILLLIDRLKSSSVSENKERIAGSIATAFDEGKGRCVLQIEIEGEKIKQHHFNNHFEMDEMKFVEPTPNLFSFSNPYGACPVCGGTGMIEGIDPDLVFPDKSLSVFEGAVACWRGEKMSEWKNFFIKKAVPLDFPIHRAIEDLSGTEYDLLWNGNEALDIAGIRQFFKFVEENLYKIQYRVLQARYRGRTTCDECKGTRLRKDAGYVKVAGKSIPELVELPIDQLHSFFKNFKYDNDYEKRVSRLIILEINNRLEVMVEVGLGYLTLSRLCRTLSGGESQRMNLATSLGSSLVGSLYILDEPSIGLHSRDTQNLIKVLKRLRDIGNTVVVVEHDEEMIRAADYIIDIGPEAGILGGKVVFQGTYSELIADSEHYTAAYLRGMDHIQFLNSLTMPTPTKRRKWRNYIELQGVKEHNLKKIDVKIPLEVLTIITGVSGSGKSTLVKNVLYPALLKMKNMPGEKAGKYSKIDADLTKIDEVLMIDQDPIGRSSRSNPATYCKVYDDIRDLFASQPLAKVRNYKSGFFSCNSPGGRCEACEGEGIRHVSMQFMADVDLICEECNGSRFKDEVLDIKIEDKNISNILEMTIDEAMTFFTSLKLTKHVQNILKKMKPMQDVGLGYLKLGQSSSSLSGGEAQRVKLAYFLGKEDHSQKSLFIFDEPTTGLHFHDIHILYKALNLLIEKGNSVIVIEHNLELIKCADWIIDLGPEGGEKGGYILCEGTPESVAACEKSSTGSFLKGKVINTIN